MPTEAAIIVKGKSDSYTLKAVQATKFRSH